MLALRFLGDVAVARDGESRPLPPSKKTRALLAYLALTGRPHRRERLCSLFWEIPDDPRGALRWSLSRLRPLVDEPGRPRILADREFVAFDASGVDIDIVSVRAALAGGADEMDTARLRALAETFRGELLEGQDMPDLHDFQAWCVAEREDARLLQIQIVSALVNRLQARPEQALPFARTLVKEQPFDERARVMLVSLLAAVGRRGEAEQRFESGQRILREAGTGTAALVAAWRTLKDGPSPSAPREQPETTVALAPSAEAQPSAVAGEAQFVGRKKELQALMTLLDEVAAGGGARCVLLTGEPGLGKSALLSELMRAVVARGGSVLLGHAYEVERDQPFGPWNEALNGLPPSESATPLQPGLGNAGEVTHARERYFESVLEAVSDRARQQAPLLLAFEDIHWVDEASAHLLHHVVRAARRPPVLVVATAREGELPDNPAVLGILRSFRHNRLFTEIALGPLLDAEIETLVGSVGTIIDSRRVVSQSAGNPLFAQEVACSLREGADGLPSTLRDLIRDRMERLPVAALEVLRWAAILGPHRLGPAAGACRGN